MICTTCCAWSYGEGDRFCANCGACLIPVEVELEASDEEQAGLAGHGTAVDLPAPEGVTYGFASRSALGALDLKLDFRWIGLDQNYVEEGHLDPLAPLDGDEEGDLHRLDISWPDAEKTGAIVLLRQPADGARDRVVRLEANPYASFRVAPRRRNLTVDRRSGRCHIYFDVLDGAVGVLDSCILKIGKSEIAGHPERAERFLREGWPLCVSFDLPPSDRKRLGGEYGALSGTVIVRPKGRNARAQSFDVNLFVSAEPSARFVTSKVLRARAGGKARVAFAIRNAGGRRITLNQIVGTWRRDGSSLRPMHEFGAHENTLDPSEELQAELRIPVTAPDGTEFEPGGYNLTLRLEYFDGTRQRAAECTIKVEVKPDTALERAICIDFGTTETAACILSGQAGASQHPRRLSIGRPPVTGDDGVVVRGRYFVPTAVALVQGQSAKPRCGDEAIALMLDRSAEAQAAEDYDVTLVENLKRDIGKFEYIGEGEDRVAYDDLVVAYLKHVISLIEDHPDVAARVGTVIVTKPAVFREQRAQKIRDAFEAAGVTVEDVPTDDGRRTLMSESWSPVMALIDAVDEDCFADMRGIKTLEQFSDDQLEDGRYLLTYDVGGGTTDLSLLKVKISDDDLIISEEAAETTEAFAGRAFEQFITGILAEEMETRGFGEVLAEFHDGDLDADLDARFKSLGRRARANRRAMNALVRTIQSDSGLFATSRGIIEGIYRTLREQRGGIGGSRPGGSRADLLDVAIQAFAKAEDDFELVAEFEGADGALAPFVMRGDALANLKARIIADFEMLQAEQMERLVLNLIDRAGLSDEDRSKVKVVASGRGSLFPPALFMIFDQMKAIFSSPVATIIKAEEGKAITSWGGLLIWHLRREAGIRFSVRSHSVLALFVKKRLTRKGQAVVHPLKDGNHWWSGGRFRVEEEEFESVRNNDTAFRIGLHYPDTGEWEDLLRIPKDAIEAAGVTAVEVVMNGEEGWTWEPVQRPDPGDDHVV